MFSRYPRTYPLLSSAVSALKQYDSDPAFLLSDWLDSQADQYDFPKFISGLAELEEYVARLQEQPVTLSPPKQMSVNPTVQIIESDWQYLPDFLAGADIAVTPGKELILIWQRLDGIVRYKTASQQDLLALKLVEDETDLDQAARENNVTIGQLDGMLEHGENEELLLVPDTLLVRSSEVFTSNDFTDKRFLSSPAFTLQWHITQVCDLHCKHCYDRSQRKAVDLEKGIAILDDFRAFCKSHNVFGQVTFTGGNPLLHNHFMELYQAAADRGFQLAILGNPTSLETIQQIQAIKPLEFYQVSLEGLEPHNDEIRGGGHFQRILTFLDILKQENIYSMVMLTLTRKNQEQVLPLAEFLRDRVDLFNFNRLAMVGEGAALMSAPTDGYKEFLEAYHEASLSNPCMGLKDNHLNTLFQNRDGKPFGGCTGYGCGAAFNFVSVLPEGEVHACRKFPSLIGNLCDDSLSEIYHKPKASQYRAGSEACLKCATRSVCGGCLAVTHGMGLDIFKDKDPYCFFEG